MTALRPLSPRPELVVGAPHQPRLEDSAGTQVGIPGPLGRARVIFALPLNGSGPVQLARATVLQGTLVADPSGNVIGESGPVWISRLLYARWTENTRRLG